jgi:hypothetical protein
MRAKLLGSVALALALAVSSGAWANPKNSFSDNNTTTVVSTAANAVGDSIGTGSVTQTAVSESFNISIEGVSVQTLSGAAVGIDLSVIEIPIVSGNNVVSDNAQGQAVGVFAINQSSGTASVQMNASSIGAAGNVSF